MEGAPGPRAAREGFLEESCAREGGAGASGRSREAPPGCTLRTLASEDKSPVQALTRGLETLCPEGSTASPFGGAPPPHALGGPLCRLQPLGGPAPAAILPTAPLPPQVTSGTTGQKPSTRALPGPGRLCPPHATSLPSLEAAASGLAAQPSTSLPLRLQSISLERLSPKFYPPAKTAQIKCHLLCERLPGLPGGGG